MLIYWSGQSLRANLWLRTKLEGKCLKQIVMRTVLLLCMVGGFLAHAECSVAELWKESNYERVQSIQM